MGASSSDRLSLMGQFGRDTIASFGDGAGDEDVIEFGAATFSNFEAVQAAARQMGSDVPIELRSEQVLLAETRLSSLGQMIFAFA